MVSKQTGKVRDKDRTWDSVKKGLLGNINGFLEELKVSHDAPHLMGHVSKRSIVLRGKSLLRIFLGVEHYRLRQVDEGDL